VVCCATCDEEIGLIAPSMALTRQGNVMKRAIAVLALSAMLTGCASVGTTVDPTVASPSAQDMATWREQMDKPILDARMAYVKKHPENPYANAIANGVIAVGMSTEDVDAAGYACEIKENSTIGSVQACDNLISNNYAISLGVDPHASYYVGFDDAGKVVSVQYP
jgi:hypothetical protein